MKWHYAWGILGIFVLLLLAGCQQATQEEIVGETLDDARDETDGEEETTMTDKLATFETSMGTFTVELDVERAPKTAGNFIKLAEEGFYDGLIFHRVIKGFMIQTGDPNGDGTGGSGYTIEDEFHPELSNVFGTISMANRGPNTGSSQFFINVANNQYLDYDKPPASAKHAVFGKVVEGISTVRHISDVETNRGDKPLTDIVIQKITIS